VYRAQQRPWQPKVTFGRRSEGFWRQFIGTEEETAEFEAQCFDDEELFAEMLELESDLLHSYVRGELSPAEQQEFETG